MTHDKRISELENSRRTTAKVHTVDHPIGRHLAERDGFDPETVDIQQHLTYSLHGRWAAERSKPSDISTELFRAGQDFNAAEDSYWQGIKDSLPAGQTIDEYLIQQLRAG